MSDSIASNSTAQSVYPDPGAKWLNDLMRHASQQGASDIHLEPSPSGLITRLRIDGQLMTYPVSPNNWRDRIVSKIKVLSRMDIAEKRLPQDGRLHWQSRELSLNLRVSSLPTIHGEKLVLRVLPHELQPRSMSQLGYSTLQLSQVRRALAAPHGLILVTGPTGSGKSATLMAYLQSLDHATLNITTVEDPVEQMVSGIHQVSINEKIGFDFATALRALLRQDPDVLMVGEIRDLQTAQVATQAAQTGHLVLSTLHTNSALGAILRLRHMGVPADHLAASLRMVCAQRLIRILCPHCKIQNTHGAWQAVGCAQCHGGFNGRHAIHEVIPLTSVLIDLVLSDADEYRLTETARMQGYVSLTDSARDLVSQGLTTSAEAEPLLQIDP